MKNRLSFPLSTPTRAQSNAHCPVMEPALALIAGGWNARKCIYLADKFERWVKQLRAQAEFLSRKTISNN